MTTIIFPMHPSRVGNTNDGSADGDRSSIPPSIASSSVSSEPNAHSCRNTFLQQENDIVAPSVMGFNNSMTERSNLNILFGGGSAITAQQHQFDEPTMTFASHDQGQAPLNFPQQLMEILSNDKVSDIIAWLPHGKGFTILEKKRFAAEVMPKYFSNRAKYTSFTRKLNRWNFTRVTRGPETGAYYHPLFQRDCPHLCLQMTCIGSKVNQTIEPMNPIALGLATPNMLDHGIGIATPSTGSIVPQNTHNETTRREPVASMPADITSAPGHDFSRQLQQLEMLQRQLQMLPSSQTNPPQHQGMLLLQQAGWDNQKPKTDNQEDLKEGETGDASNQNQDTSSMFVGWMPYGGDKDDPSSRQFNA